MNKQLALVREFHRKFHIPVLEQPGLVLEDRSALRHRLMKDEVEEYAEGVQNQDLPNIAKELADVLYSVYGTILEHGLQDKMEAVFEEVHRSNMTKTYHQYKLLKGEQYQQADIKSLL